MQDIFEGTSNCDAGDGYEVVTTGMPNTRKGIHLTINANCAATYAVGKPSFPSGWEVEFLCDLEAFLCEERGEDIVRMAVITR